MSWTEELFCNLRVNSPQGSLLTDLSGNLLSATTLLIAEPEMNSSTWSEFNTFTTWFQLDSSTVMNLWDGMDYCY